MEKKKIKIKKIIPINYCGSLIQQNFGEKVSNHGFLIWDITTKEYTEHNVDNKSPYYQFKITSLEDIEKNNEKITNL